MRHACICLVAVATLVAARLHGADAAERPNILFIFTSDQGFAWGQHGFRHKMAAYDANIRSPMMISYPKVIPTGSVCETPVGGVDIVPTIFSFAGLDPP